MIKRKNILLLICLTLLIFTGCGKDKTMAEDMASLDDISDTIASEIKTSLMSAGAAVESDFQNGMLGSYSMARLKDEDFNLPIEYDKSKLEDGLIITHNMNVKSDMIIVLKAKTDADIPTVENYIKQISQEHHKSWENYLPDQYEKVKNGMTKTMGRYVIYVTYDEPNKIMSAVENLMK